MTEFLGKDLSLPVNSELTRAPYNEIGRSEPSGPQYMTGADLMRSAKISPDWKGATATESLGAYMKYGPGSQFVTATLEYISDDIANLPAQAQNIFGNWLLSLDDTTRLKKLYAKNPEALDAINSYEETIGALNGRQYPSNKWARRIIANANEKIENRQFLRDVLRNARGIEDNVMNNEVASSLAFLMTAGVGGISKGVASLLGAGAKTATKAAKYTGMGLTGAIEAGQYAQQTTAQYLEETGDRTFSNFSPSDATGLSALVYGAIAAKIEYAGGLEPLLIGAIKKTGASTLGKAIGSTALGEGAEEFGQKMAEYLTRTVDGSSRQTFGEAFLEGLQGAGFGTLFGGTIGTAAHLVNRGNLTKRLKQMFPTLKHEQAQQIADTMIDMALETSTTDNSLRGKLRQKVEAIYSESDTDANTIDALTDLEYALIVTDANERGIDLASHPLFAGEVNELGWFRDGIPEARRAEIEGYAKEIRDLRAELKTLNEAKEKDWAKIEEVEAKLEAAVDLIPERISGLVVADRAQMAQMLTEQRDLIARKNALRKVQQRARIAAAREAEKEERISERERQRQERKEAQAAESDRRQAVRNLTRKIKEDADLKLQKAKAEIPLATKESLQAVLLKAGFDRAVVAQMGIRTLRSQVRQLKNADLSLLKRDPELVKQKKIAKVPNIMENQGEIDAIEELGYQTLRDAGYSNRQIAKMSQGEMLKVLRQELISRPATVLNQEAFDIAEQNARLDTENPEYTGDTIVINGKERTVYNSNGDRIAKSEAALRNFYNWFGDSKVADDKGRPLVVYHGTDVQIQEFQGDAFFFTDKLTGAESFGQIIYPVYLNMSNPLIVDAKNSSYYDLKIPYNLKRKLSNSTSDALAEYAKNKGYDGLILNNVYELGSYKGSGKPAGIVNDFIAFQSNQIKSTENRGTFSAEDPNIYHQGTVSGTGDTSRGAYIPEYRFIAITRKMDESTVAHELAHDWIDQYFRYAQSGKASKEYMKRWAVLSKALGIKEGDIRVSSEASEKFARAYEGWLLKKDWDKALNVADDEKRRLIEEFKRYQQSLRDIYSGLTDKYFKQTWGKTGELDPRIQAWFEKFGDIDVEELEASREPMTPAQESQRAVDKAIDIVIDNSTDPETKKRLTAAKLLNDTSRYEVKGGNKNSLQRRLSALAKDIDQDGVLVNENYNTHRDMMAVAEAADNFVKTRQQEAIDIINGVKPETDGLYASDLYTALERVAIETGDLDLLNELRGSKVANLLAKELGQRVAGFRNYKQAGIDYVQTVKALDRKYAEAAGKEKGKAQIAEATALLKEAQAEQDARDTKTLDSLLDMLKCK